MKTLKSLFVLAGVLSITASSSFAREHHIKVDLPDATETDSSVPNRNYFGLGFSTVQNFLPAANGVNNYTPITALIGWDQVHAVQIYFSMPHTSPFAISGGAHYKRTIFESQGAGFHVGGGVGAGVSNGANGGPNTFLSNLSLLMGFHFSMPGANHVKVHLDGGPTFGATNQNGNGATDFGLSAFSAGLGASVIYVF